MQDEQCKMNSKMNSAPSESCRKRAATRYRGNNSKMRSGLNGSVV